LFIAYICSSASEYLDNEHWFRGYIISATCIFVFCYMSAHDILPSTTDEYTGESIYDIIDYMPLYSVLNSGKYLILFTSYVVSSYIGLMIGQYRLYKNEANNRL
jgi:hypothetical protein